MVLIHYHGLNTINNFTHNYLKYIKILSMFIWQYFLLYLRKIGDRFYVGYAAWLLPSHPSVPSLIPFPRFCQTDRNRSGPNPGYSRSKRNYSSSTKSGEKELKQIKKELWGSNLRPDRFRLHPSPLFIFPSSHFSVPESRNHAK